MSNRVADSSPTILATFPELCRKGQAAESGLILGLGAFGHDTAAAIVDSHSGQVLFAVAEERLTNRKHDWHYPVGAVHECCREAIRLGRSLVGVAVNFRSEEFIAKTLFNEIDRLGGLADGLAELKSGLLSHLPQAEYLSLRHSNATNDLIAGLLSACELDDATKAQLLLRMTWYFNWAVKYRNIEETILRHFKGLPIHFVNHHLAHAASAFYSSGFDDATVLVVDGSGEADTVTIYRGDSDGLSLVSRTGWPHSLGIFYLFATEHLGFGLGDEYKVMGMSAYGRPRFFDQLSDIMKVDDHARLILQETAYQSLGNLGGIGHIAFQFTDRLREILPVRQKSDPFRQEHFDFAASIQKLTEDTGVALAKKAIALTGLSNLAIAGGVGLNGLMNEAIRQRSKCDDIFIYPAAADDGTAVGAAQWLAAQDHPLRKKRITSCYFGHDVLPEAALAVLAERKIIYSRPDSIHEQIAIALAEGKIVARCHGRAEFGPRALGHRSILGHPGLASMKETLNVRVKHREEFRPFAPACLRERVSEYFELEHDAPFMLLIAKAKQLARLKVPSVVHVDGTARVQTVSESDNPDFYRVISEFAKITGLPIVLNTSFNVNGETIVDSAVDALESFGFMDIDYMAIGPYWVSKNENADKFPVLLHDDYLEIRSKRFRERNLGSLAELDISVFDNAFLDVEKDLDDFMTRQVVGRPNAIVAQGVVLRI